jgi:hypothetical protein
MRRLNYNRVLTYWNCTAFELGIFSCVLFFCLFCFWGFFSPLMRWQNYFWDNISRIGGWGTNTIIIKTETLLHWNLRIILNLSLSLQCLFSLLLISTLSLPVYCFDTGFFFVVCFFLLGCLFIPFSLPSLLSLSSHPSIQDITIVIIVS